MTPRFSLTLSHEGIGLLHRTKTGWNEVGHVALDDPDLNAALRVLRATASGLEGGGVLSELVLPDSQILYTRVTPAGALDEAGIRKGLEGLTPYAVNELVFDWEADGDGALVAVVARETLAEAESFAVEHRFNPVSFTARPAPDQFPRDPLFGPTQAAATLLPEDENPAPAAPTQTGAPEAQEVPEPEKAAPPAPSPAAPETPSAPERPLIAPLPAPEDRPAFATRRDPSQPPSAAAPVPQTASAKARLTLAPSRTTPPPDLAGGKIGVTAPEAPAVSPQPERARAGAAKKPAARKDSAKAPKAEPPKATAPRAPAPVTTRVAAPPPKAPEGDLGLPGLFAPEPPSSGLPKLGLALTAALLLILLLVALWALFLRDPDAPETAEVTADPPAAATQAALAPSAPDAPPAAPAPAAEAAADTPAPAEDLPPAEADAPRDLSPEELQTLYAATGIYPVSPEPPAAPEQDRVDDVYIASLDPRVTVQDAVALPAVPAENHDARPDTPASPAGPGNRFDLDARGLVRPSPEGTLNPDGVTVFSGPPRITPPARPETDTALDPAVAQEAARLAAVRPRTRPNDLSETNERANLGGFSRAELSARRPLARPESLQEQALAEAEAEAEADGEVADAGAVTTSALAVASSPKPPTRPGDFPTLVEKALAEAQAAPAPAAVVPAAVVPAAVAVAPNIPSSASVAKQATLPNAINLREINLIGIYGSSVDRRALVRLKSGRYVKVQVGDQLDGGQVTAIGEGELRYVRRGRNEVLKLPQG
ncbi:hypothetical protein [Actibacterium sp. MT2.3-13A]|uniref:hypothetical protein n=1 Tax=Actibacterium sp. MT2.3-13A TaxID=2828332 RepID=UPI001BAA2A2D|nr:hypothetical protein [Actibacterium sp. MT2.3-13A]